MEEAARFESAGHIGQIAVNMESRRQRGKSVGEIALVIAVVVDELVDRGIDVPVRKLVQAGDDEMPVRAEFVLESQLADVGGQIDAGKRLPVALSGRIGRILGQQDTLRAGDRERSGGRRVREPAGIAVLKQVVVAVIPFNYRASARRTSAATAANWRRSWLSVT